MKILVVSSCTAKKKGKGKKYYTTSLLSLSGKAKFTARELYQGRQHVKAVESVDLLRNQGHDVDFYVLSAHYGLVGEYEEIESYEATFRKESPGTIREIAKKLKIDEKMLKLYQNDYDVSFFLLSRNYVIAISEAVDELDAYSVISVIFSDKKKSPGKHVQLLKIDRELMESLKEKKLKTGGYVGIRGYLFNYFSQVLVTKEKDFLKIIHSDPDRIKEWFKADFIAKMMRTDERSENILSFFGGKSRTSKLREASDRKMTSTNVKTQTLLSYFS